MSRPEKEYWVKANSPTDLIQSVAAYGGERIIRLPKGTWTLDQVLSLPDYTHIKGYSRRYTILRRSADQYILELTETSGNIEHVQIEDLSLSGSDGAFTSPLFHGYNMKACILEKLRLMYFAGDGFLLEGQSDTYYSYYNTIKDIFVDMGVTNAQNGVFHIKSYYWDSYFNNMMGSMFKTGNLSWGGITWLLEGQLGTLHIDRSHVDHAYTDVKVDSTNANGLSNVHFRDLYCDYMRNQPIHLKTSVGSITDLEFESLMFNAVPTGFPLILLETTGNINRLHVNGAYGSAYLTGHTYIAQKTGAGNIADSVFCDIKLPTGSSGAYDGIPDSMIFNDKVYEPRYQTQTGAWANPTWVGTPKNGERVVVYNSTAGEYRTYTYVNGGWHYSALT